MEKILIPDPSLIILVGSSGAGKSTFAGRHFEPTEIVSSDHCRALICDDESDQSVTLEAFQLLHHIAALRLSYGRLTVIDATNLQARARQPLLAMSRRFELPAIALVFNVSLETCLANNRGRSHRFVDEEAIRHHSLEFDRALGEIEHEGFAAVHLLNENSCRSAKIERLKSKRA